MNKLVNVEAIGFGDALERASLMYAVDRSDTVALVQLTGAVMVFMRETGREGGHDWCYRAA